MTEQRQFDKDDSDGLRIGGHQWVEANDLVKWPHCAVCMTIRRHDDKNKPCKGAAKIALRNYYTEGSMTDDPLAVGIEPFEWDGDNIVQDVSRGIAADIVRLARLKDAEVAAARSTTQHRDEGLEEAAKIADYMGQNNTGGEQLMAERIAYAIRNRKGSTVQSATGAPK